MSNSEKTGAAEAKNLDKESWADKLRDRPAELLIRAVMEESGPGSGSGNEELEKAWRRLAALGDSYAAWRLGRMMLRAGKEDDALGLFRKASAGGSADASLDLAELILRRMMTPLREPDTAVIYQGEWVFKNWGAPGSPEREMESAARRALEGFGREQKAAALPDLRKADSGRTEVPALMARSEYLIGRALSTNLLCPLDRESPESPFYWFRLAAGHGCAEAFYWYAKSFLVIEEGTWNNEADQYVRYLHEGASKGDGFAGYALWICQRAGMDESADDAAGFQRLCEAAEQGCGFAVQDLYMILRGYSEGDEDLKDTEAARKLLQNAKESGMPEYQVCLGADAENAEDHKKAFACYCDAALRGSSIGALLAAECLMNGIGTDTDYYRAGWYLWIASLGGALYISQSAAGLLAAGGLGRERDPDLGFRLFMHEARFGNVECGKAAAGCLPLVQDADPADVSWLTGLFYELAHGSVEYALTYAGLLLYGGRPVKALAFAEAAEESGVEGAAEFAAGLRQRVGIIGRICAWFLARSLYGKFNREA
nr:sel1 repeat family protein [Succinivibrionaceae bacterium]